MAEEGDSEILDIEQNVWADRLERDRYNLRALEWLHVSGRAQDAMAMAGALRWFWVIKREVSDGTEWLERTLSHREGVDPSIVARALNGAGLLASRRLRLRRGTPPSPNRWRSTNSSAIDTERRARHTS